MSTACDFVLNSPNAVYHSGAVVGGTISLKTTKDKDVNNVRIVFKGEGKVKWTSGSSKNKTSYKSHDVYVNHETIVHGDGVLPKGLHSYTFSINLPFDCPTSCEAKYGHIRYGISLILDRPYRFDNVFQKPLTVLQTVDLNSNPVFKIPVVAEDIGDVSCFSCSNGNLLYSLRIPFGAYAPGQVVNYALRIQNQAMTDTEGYSVIFSQKQTFIAHSPWDEERHKKTILVEQRFADSCLRMSTRDFQGQIRIPALPSSTTDPNAIIKLEYKIKVKVHLSGCHSDTDLRIPIVIGTIPIRESLQTDPLTEAAAPEASATAPELDNNDIDLPPSYKLLKPPSFEEAKTSDSPFVDNDIDERHRLVGFRPLYPMYS